MTGKNQIGNENLARMMAEVGKKHGYDEVRAEFTAYRDFKIRWTRSNRWAEFQISDYLEDAPENVLRELAEMIFARIRGQNVDYPEEVREWLTAPEFPMNHRSTYLGRFVGVSDGTRGRHIDLAECRKRLVESGLVDKDDDIEIRWAHQNSRSVGRSSTLMRVVTINDVLDNEDVDEDAIDFALYAEMCKVNQGYGPLRRGPDEVDALISRFEKRSEAEFNLATFGIRI